jgi:hypothetical protein
LSTADGAGNIELKDRVAAAYKLAGGFRKNLMNRAILDTKSFSCMDAAIGANKQLTKAHVK